jgi:hypothetical protein
VGQSVRGKVLRRALLQMKAQFLVNLPLHHGPLPQRAKPLPDDFWQVHQFTFPRFHALTVSRFNSLTV